MIAEAVERASAREVADEHAILALIEERAGLLTVSRRGEEAHAVLVHFDFVGHVAAQQLDADGKLLLGAQRNVVARENSVGVHELVEHVDDRDREMPRARRS